MNRAKVRIKLNQGAISKARDDKVVGGGSFFSCDAMPCLTKRARAGTRVRNPWEKREEKTGTRNWKYVGGKCVPSVHVVMIESSRKTS